MRKFVRAMHGWNCLVTRWGKPLWLAGLFKCTHEGYPYDLLYFINHLYYPSAFLSLCQNRI